MEIETVTIWIDSQHEYNNYGNKSIVISKYMFLL